MKKRKPKLTIPMIEVLNVLLEEPHKSHYGLEIAKSSGRSTATIYAILARLEHELNWVKSEWEKIDACEAGRPARCYYKITSQGARAARIEIANTLSRMMPPLNLRHGVP